MLERLNTPAVANAGLVAGGGSIIAAGAYFLSVLSDPNELVALFEAAKEHHDPAHAVARLAAAAIAFAGAIALALLAAYLGRPSTLHPVSRAGSAGQPAAMPHTTTPGPGA